MLKKCLLTIIAIALSAISTTVYSMAANPWPEFYSQAPEILIIDPMAVMAGSMPEGANMLTIKLTDVALYSGRICPSMAAGYMLTKKAMDALYPNSIPQRGQIRVSATAAATELMEVTSYITGVRPLYGRGEINACDLVIDPSLKPKKHGQYVMVFQRKDTGKAVKGVYNKFKLIPEKKIKKIKKISKKILQGNASPREKEKNWSILNTMVEKVLMETPEGVIEIIPMEGYQFPESPAK